MSIVQAGGYCAMAAKKNPAPTNALYYGDNLEILREKIPTGTVDVCYIDPPFNSQQNYFQIYNDIKTKTPDRALAQAFTDTWEWNEQAIAGFNEILDNPNGRFTSQTVELIKGLHSSFGKGTPLLAYIVSLTQRITEIYRVLKPTGSFYLHCDPTASHYLKLVLDSVFLPQGGDYKNEIIWRRTGSHNSGKSFGPIHDVIFFYTKSVKGFHFKTVKRSYMKGHVERRYTKDETGRYKFTSGGNVLTGKDKRDKQSGLPWRGFDPTAKNRHWAIPGFLAEQMDNGFKDMGVIEKLDALYEAGLIEIKEGNVWPTPVRYLTDKSGLPLQDIWAFQPYTKGTVHGTQDGIDSDVKWLGPTSPERLGFQTQKPVGLLTRIIESSCPEAGIVLDAYCGCGTTIDTAQRLGRKWIGIDITYQSIIVVLDRLEKRYGKEFVESIGLNGIPKDMKSAVALSQKKDDRLRKEFEKWAVLTYTKNRAVINERKGADGGIDGIAFFKTGKNGNAKIVLQVKSGIVQRNDIAALRGDMERVGAVMAVLITLKDPTKRMIQDAREAGSYKHEYMGGSYDKSNYSRLFESLVLYLA